MNDNELMVTLADGNKVKIKVLDIDDSVEYNKSFIFYSLVGDDNTVFASILNEDSSSFSLDTIVSEKELDYVNQKIDEFVKEGD